MILKAMGPPKYNRSLVIQSREEKYFVQLPGNIEPTLSTGCLRIGEFYRKELKVTAK
jgi:hypothetical protein